jgi:hypothetical protein
MRPQLAAIATLLAVVLGTGMVGLAGQSGRCAAGGVNDNIGIAAAARRISAVQQNGSPPILAGRRYPGKLSFFEVDGAALLMPGTITFAWRSVLQLQHRRPTMLEITIRSFQSPRVF